MFESMMLATSLQKTKNYHHYLSNSAWQTEITLKYAKHLFRGNTSTCKAEVTNAFHQDGICCYTYLRDSSMYFARRV